MRGEEDERHRGERLVRGDPARGGEDDRRALRVDVADQHQILAVLGRGGDGGDHVLAGPLGDDPAERVIDEAELEQVGDERDQRDERRERGAGATGQRVDGESQQQRRGGQQVRLEDRAGAGEALHLGGQTELPQDRSRNTAAPRRSPSVVGPRGPMSTARVRMWSSHF